MEKLVWDNRAIRNLPIDSENRNFIRQVSRACLSFVVPTPISRPKVVVYSKNALRLLGIKDLPEDPDKMDKSTMNDLARYFSGNDRFSGSQPYAQCYAGHQFGSFAGQLGDGAAISLGEVVAPIPPSDHPLILDGFKFPIFTNRLLLHEQLEKEFLAMNNNNTQQSESTGGRKQQQQSSTNRKNSGNDENNRSNNNIAKSKTSSNVSFTNIVAMSPEECDAEAANAIVATTILGCDGTLLQPENHHHNNNSASHTSSSTTTAAAAAAAVSQEPKHVYFASTNEKKKREKAQRELLEANRKGNSVFLTIPHSRWEVQLKGAGPTPFSRTADGRKVLRSSLREFLCSEAMFSLNIPTTRAGILVVSSGDTVERDPMYTGDVITEPVSVCTRIAPNFIRFGSFEICKPSSQEEEEDFEDEVNSKNSKTAAGIKKSIFDENDAEDANHFVSSGSNGRAGPSAETGLEPIISLFEFTAKFYFPREWRQADAERKQTIQAAMLGSKHLPTRALAAPIVFKSIVRSTARLVAQWQCAGFVHGVLNTDNMSILGLTIDYGPFQFMEYFDKELVGNSSDHTGRYCYENQPEMCKWNCVKLLESFRLMFPETMSEMPKEVSDFCLETNSNENSASCNSNSSSMIRDFRKNDMLWVSYYFDESYKNERRNILRAKLFGVLSTSSTSNNNNNNNNIQQQQQTKTNEASNSADNTRNQATQQQQPQQEDKSKPVSVEYRLQQAEIDAKDKELSWQNAVDELDRLLFDTLEDTSADFTKVFPILEKLQPQMVVALTHYITAITTNSTIEPDKAANLLKKMQQTTDEVLQRLAKKLGATGAGRPNICAPADVRVATLQRRCFAMRPRTPLATVQQLLALKDAELSQMFPQAPAKVIRREFQLMAEQGAKFLRYQKRIKEMHAVFGSTPEQQASRETTALLEQHNCDKWLAFLKVFEKRLRESWLRSLPEHFTPRMLEVEIDRREHVLCLSNPRIILRNWIAQSAIDAAEKGDYKFVHKLLERLENPFVDPKKEKERKEKRKKEREARKVEEQRQGIFFFGSHVASANTIASISATSGSGNDNNNNNSSGNKIVDKNNNNIESAGAVAARLKLHLATLSKSGKIVSGGGGFAYNEEDEDDEDGDDIFCWSPPDAYKICVSCSS